MVLVVKEHLAGGFVFLRDSSGAEEIVKRPVAVFGFDGAVVFLAG